MSDYDADVDAAFNDHSTAPVVHPDYDDDVHAAFAAQPAPAPRPIPTASQHASDVLGIAKRHPLTVTAGLGENVISGATSGLGALADAVTLSEPGTHDWTYRPRTEAGKEIAGAAADEAGAMGRLYDKIPATTLSIPGAPPVVATLPGGSINVPGGDSPLGQTIKRYGPEALGAVGTVTGLSEIPAAASAVRGAIRNVRSPNVIPRDPVTTVQAQAALDAAAANSPQSMGAASSAVRVNELSPGMQGAFRKAVQETGGAVNPDAAINHREADIHGVDLMEGQATRDPVLYADEQNSTDPKIIARINKQEEQMTDAIDKIRREATPGHVQNNHIENGQIAVDSLKAYDEPIKADINAKYDAARKASANGDLQMDGSSFVNNANAALKPQSKFRYLPSTVQGILDDVAASKGRMSLDDYQAYQTQLGNEISKARRAGDGNAESAITKVYAELQKVEPLGTETAQAKSLFDTARSAAKARFDAMDADPAYAAAVEEVDAGIKKGKPSPMADGFLDKYVIGKGAPKANVDALMGKLDEDGKAAVTAHTLNAIRKGAVTSNGKISPAGYNSAMEKYGPKLDSLVAPETRESLDSLGRVITNAKVAPPGAPVNYSKSGVIVNAAKHVGEAAVNAKTFGLGMPIIRNIAQSRATKRTLAPGAGLTRLSDVANK
jgi:hypothetical protein